MILMQKIRFILFLFFILYSCQVVFSDYIFALNVNIAETIKLIFALNKKHKICLSTCWKYEG